jgi:hypothetical protein
MTKTSLLPALLTAAALTTPVLTAQTILWGPVLPTVAPTDVNGNGSLVVARNLHASGATQSPVVNGVTFVGNFAPTGWTNASTIALQASTTGDTNYDLMLNSARATSAAATANPTGWGAIRIDTLGTLTVGRDYEIQCWFTDQRPGPVGAAIYDRAMTLSSAVGSATLAGGEVTNLGSLLQGPTSAALDGDPDNFPAIGSPDTLFGTHCTGRFTRVNATDQLWLLVQGTHPIPTNNLRSHLTAFQIRELPLPTWSTYGAGCAGPAGTMALQLVSLPAIAGTFSLDVTNAGPGLVIMLTGLTQFAIPLSGPEFVPGCTLLTTLDILTFVPTVGGTGNWSFPLPYEPSWAGVQVFNQAIEFGALWSLSNGGQGTLQ